MILLKLQESNKECGISYKEEEVVSLVKKYKKDNDAEKFRMICKMCYPIIFQTIKKFASKFYLDGKPFQTEDLFDEAILVLHNVIKNFDPNKGRFMVYLWISLIRGYSEFVTDNIVEQEKLLYLEMYDNDRHRFMMRREIELELNKGSIVEINLESIKHLLTKDEYKILKMRTAKKRKAVKLIVEEMGITIVKYYKIMDSIKNKVGGELL